MKAQFSAQRTLSWIRHHPCLQEIHPMLFINMDTHMCLTAAWKTTRVSTETNAKIQDECRKLCMWLMGSHASLCKILVLLPLPLFSNLFDHSAGHIYGPGKWGWAEHLENTSWIYLWAYLLSMIVTMVSPLPLWRTSLEYLLLTLLCSLILQLISILK